jgi:hypothetical protein
MAELTAVEATADPCCAPEQQTTCCEPSAKADCCGHGDDCGCAASTATTQAASAIVRAQSQPHERLGMNLPMAPSCALDDAGLRLQHERYRRAGQGAQIVERTRHRLVVDFDEHVDNKLVDETIAIERSCCPFLTLGWEPHRRRLTISVSEAEHEPALDAIAFALDLIAPPQHVASQ